jgi:hypothetical protein
VTSQRVCTVMTSGERAELRQLVREAVRSAVHELVSEGTFNVPTASTTTDDSSLPDYIRALPEHLRVEAEEFRKLAMRIVTPGGSKLRRQRHRSTK